jgi:hypothetical protein
MQKITVSKPFISTKNVRNFDVMMDGLAMAEGESRFGLVWSEAGRGKSRTVKIWHANNEASIYLYVRNSWKTCYTDFLQALCVELGVRPAPKRKGQCFSMAVDSLLTYPRVVIIDEIEKLPNDFLDMTRDLTELTGCAILLVGEEELMGHMKQNKRVWSRTFQMVEFKTIEVGDIMLYIKKATAEDDEAGYQGLAIGPDNASAIYGLTGGNFRDVRRLVINLVKICNDKKTESVDIRMIKTAYKMGLTGKMS